MIRHLIILVACLTLPAFALGEDKAGSPEQAQNESAPGQVNKEADKQTKKAEKEKKKAEKEKKKAEKEAEKEARKEQRRKEHEERRAEDQQGQGVEERHAQAGKPQTQTQSQGQKAPFEERFKQADADGDRKLSRAEAGKGFTSGIAKNFDAMDSNRDGFVTAKEREAFVSKSQAAGNK